MKLRYWLMSAALTSGIAHAGLPTPSSVKAAKATAANNSLCTAIMPFYWEIGDARSVIVSESEGVNSSGAPVLGTTKLNVDSSAKWLYGTYVVQVRGSAANLTAQDIDFLHMTSGYTNMGGDNHPAGTCPPSDDPDTVNACLLLDNPANGLPYDYQNPATIGFFDYDGGHFENHASQFTALGNVPNNTLGLTVAAQLGPDVKLTYSQPLLPGGANMTSEAYGKVLQNIVSGKLAMLGALGIYPVCTLASATCDALDSPIPWAWNYSIGHWVEDDPTVNDDGAFSSPGRQGFYPWIEAGKTYYGLIGRAVVSPHQEGVLSTQCGQMIRHAWDTGVQQTESIRSR
jgi:hypothetical protein